MEELMIRLADISAALDKVAIIAVMKRAEPQMVAQDLEKIELMIEQVRGEILNVPQGQPESKG